MIFEPELLRFENGDPVKNATEWRARREEILNILRREVYGSSPISPEKVEGEIISNNAVCCSGHACLQRIKISFETDKGIFSFPFNLFLPHFDTPVPIFVLLNFRPDVYDMYYPAEEIIDNGFALAVINYHDITADTPDMNDGISGMYDLSEYSWGKIGMWAFGASRVLDYLTARPEIDVKNAAVIGHSRLGKTALWCAAQDERFRFAISNDSGSGGAAYGHAKVEGNEMIKDSIYYFPYWYCEKYPSWIGHDHELPFDQHFLLAAIAPRFVCVGSAHKDIWAGPYQEQLSCIGASPAWELLGESGYIGKTEPADIGDDFSDGNIGYHLRDGIHFLGRGDWLSYMSFVKKHLYQQ
jgi:hypothetical protein